jgi:hypothetical protein
MPSAFIFKHRAKVLAKKLPLDKQEETLKRKGFTFSFSESMPCIIAVLGPLLAGPIGELFKWVPAAL